MTATKRRVIRAYRPSKANNHPAVILGTGRGFVHAITGTSHPSGSDRRCPSVVVVEGSTEARAMGLDATTYFFPHMYHVLTEREFEDWNGGRFTTPDAVFRQLQALVQTRMIADAPPIVLPPTALTFQASERVEDE